MITYETGHSAQQASREGKEGEGLASGHCVVWLVGWLVDWLTGFESDGRLSDYMSEDDGKTD